MKCILFIVAVLLIGCSSLQYSNNSDFYVKNHSFSYTEISDSSLLNKKTQINFLTDSVLYGKIIEVSNKHLKVVSLRSLDTLSVPFMEIKSFQVSGYPLPYYNRVSFGYGFAFAFLVLVMPATIAENNETNPSNQTPELTLGFMGLSFVSAYLLSNNSEYSPSEMHGAIVTIHVK